VDTETRLAYRASKPLSSCITLRSNVDTETYKMPQRKVAARLLALLFDPMWILKHAVALCDYGRVIILHYSSIQCGY